MKQHIRSIVIGAAIIAALSTSTASAQPQAQPEQRYIDGCYVLQARYTVFNTYIPLCHRLGLPVVAKSVR